MSDVSTVLSDQQLIARWKALESMAKESGNAKAKEQVAEGKGYIVSSNSGQLTTLLENLPGKFVTQWNTEVKTLGVWTGSDLSLTGTGNDQHVSQASFNSVTLTSARENEDFISQASYVELVNALRDVEDWIDESSTRTSLRSSSDKKDFWGITHTDANLTIRNSDADRATQRKANVLDWESSAASQGLKKDFSDLSSNIALNSDNGVMLAELRALKGPLELIRSMGLRGKLSPALNAQAVFVGDLGKLFTAVIDDVKPGSDLSSVQANLREGYKAFVSAGGFNHLQLIKKALVQYDPSVSVNSTLVRPSVADLVFFEYASTGEASLNRQIGALGEQMKNLNKYLEALNTVDRIFNSPSLEPDPRGYLATAPSSSAISDEDLRQLKDALVELDRQFKINADGYSNASTFVAGEVGQLNEAQRKAVGKLLGRIVHRKDDANTALSNDYPSADETPITQQDNGATNAIGSKYGVGGSMGAGQDFQNYANGMPGSTAAELTLTRAQFRNAFNDEQLHTDLANAITFGQGVNDDVKQKLKKVMFVYQEFIKSAGSVIEKVAQLIKAIAQKVA